ncbi:hypothetical protein K9N68_35035 (plasmid) [Kovacikia minuta CCNUW1]|uniref:hypothetical protein n=1 Tax=Kovacikia minuta TaxID=2931930 RepID=UPI001CCC4811|nr:hypothetical protein [Kovacikia minuta]UBF30415.1 hypothetical protein K9N68_35035 [Kovacikia minuta CCNUW1]
MRRIHHRDILTLLGSDASTVDWQRVAQGFAVEFGLRSLILFSIYLINPSRYRFAFSASEWLISLPFSLLLAGYSSLVACLFFYGYLFQGMSCLIPNPVRLITVYGLILGTLQALSVKNPVDWIGAVFFQIFLLWIILKDKRLEVAIGLITAGSFFSYTIWRSVSRPLQTPTILVRSAESLSPVIYLVLAVIEAVLFYVIWFYVIHRDHLRSPE